MTEADTALADLDGWTQTFENATADARISEEGERDLAHAVRRGREAWAAYVAATEGEPYADVRDRTPAAFFGA